MIGWLLHRPRWQLLFAALMAIAIVVSFAAAAVTLVERQNTVIAQREAIAVTCRQIEKVRADLVGVLEAARADRLQYGRPAGYTDAQEAQRQLRIRAFYGVQLVRVRPVRCP